MIRLVIFSSLLFLHNLVFSQNISHIKHIKHIKHIHLDNQGIIQSLETESRFIAPFHVTPLVSFIFDNKDYSLTDGEKVNNEWLFDRKLSLEITEDSENGEIWLARFVFKNQSSDTLNLENVVIFGTESTKHFITGKGDHWLSRTQLFRPGQSSVPVILPDNAWELSYCDLPLDHSTLSAVGLTRRKEWDKAQRKRFETLLYPGGSVTYQAYCELYEGNWQEGLRLLFQKRFLYDLESFDNSLFEREDLKWIQDKYVIHLMMAWDHHYTDIAGQNYRMQNFIARGKNWYGGDDVIGLWPTWPALGLDQRNQWDLFRDLPGGLPGLRETVDSLHQKGVRFFICYNPWDESTRFEDHLRGMAEIISATDADGVVLDTRGSSSKAIQDAADSVREGVVMYSEGMAIPKDMPGIISGRVHNALYYPPLLNLNKLIKPDFAIFRVAELTLERIRREYNISLFNGHGVEINMFRPGQPDWIEEDYKYLGRIARILRENTTNFHSLDYIPLVQSLKDSVYINYWPGNEKNLYTIYSMIPQGVNDPLMILETEENEHLIDLWNHNELKSMNDTLILKLDAFHKSGLGTNNEGSVNAVAVFREHLFVKLNGPVLEIESIAGNSIKIWKGMPSYEKKALILPAGKHQINLIEHFRRFEGKIVVQLFEKNELIDERIVNINPGSPILISKVIRTEGINKVPGGMVFISGGIYKWITSHGDDFIGYPLQDSIRNHQINSFYMDRYPVTNLQFKKFLDESNYRPKHKKNFLKHWINGQIPTGQENFPVGYISSTDAIAYAAWAGKRLPTEMEWQYAAQEGGRKKWPWGSSLDSTKTNMGTGIPYAVGLFPDGANAWGLEDLCGQVWQMTNDVYESGSYRYQIVKGGSYYKPTSSWWYVQGGPQPPAHRQILLMVSDEFDRQATVGFRCVVDYRRE